MELNLPSFEYKVKKENGQMLIFDVIRKKYVIITPEEWVRQHFVHYLVNHKKYPLTLMAVEKEIDLYGLKRRFDIVCFDRKATPFLIVECKAPSVSVCQKVFEQAFNYNVCLQAKYVVIINGIKHFCGYIEHEKGFCLLNNIPEFNS
ncbi:MAG: type I restriction enzyme HsdR N-terminal domain-containing protein [Odoribacter sp.]|nr:type I restriction enzyme HsdR N-terminal domain-containing protein [Odoribacter sp.]